MEDGIVGEKNDHSSILCFLRLYYRCDERVKDNNGLDKMEM